ncbi:sensor histidine kinase [Streptomyces sp. NPDC050560]|uniref:sensor histidine kinase n=1 Tax=Streptomyces sp. NPDC050560 TaxID=3365630 RepID=UPI0037B1E8F3
MAAQRGTAGTAPVRARATATVAATARDEPSGAEPRRQGWRLSAAFALGVAVWLAAGVVLAWERPGGLGAWYRYGDPVVALGCLVLLWWRRYRPVVVTSAVLVASTTSAMATGAAFLALVSLAARRRPREIGGVLVLYAAASVVGQGRFPVGRPAEGTGWGLAVWLLVTAGVLVALGVAVGARRAEVASLRARAAGARRERAALEQHARVRERARIAREMHDVLAHRISLLALQAGALEHRDAVPAREDRRLVRGIADASRLALRELRDVLGVLRAGTEAEDGRGGAVPAVPSFAAIPELVAQARRAGLDVALSVAVSAEPAAAVGRTCYRTVQEGLTNAAKHAPDGRVEVLLDDGGDGGGGGSLRVRVRTGPSAATTTAAPPASGLGLAGLAERVGLLGGTLEHGPAPDGGHLLTVRLPLAGSVFDGGA